MATPENNGLTRHTAAFGLALAVASIVNSLLVVAKEKSPAVLAGMKSLTGHHWITHSVIVVGLFLLLGAIFARANGGQGVRFTVTGLIRTVVGGVAAGALLILGFYLLGD